MGSLLEDRIAELRRRVRRLLLLNGLGWLFAVTVGAMFVVGGVDWLIRFDDTGVRLILSLSIVAAAGWVGYRLLIAPLLVRLSNLDLALRIESRHPELKDSLASTVQFLERGIDPAIGSPELQQGVVKETLDHLDSIDFRNVVETRNVRRIVIAAGVIGLLTAITVGLNRADASIAFKRMVLPLSATKWPKQTELRILSENLQKVLQAQSPIRVTRGDTLKVYIENAKGRLPADGTVHFRFPDGREASQRLTSSTTKDPSGRQRDVFVASMIVLEGPIEFRAEGGDDHEMPWYVIQAVVAPRLKDLQISLTPPAYTQKSVERLPVGAGHIEGLLETTVTLQARSDKKLRSAKLHVGKQKYDVQVDVEGFQLSVEFPITEKGTAAYGLAMWDIEDSQESRGPRYDIRGIEDTVPLVEIAEPDTNLQVTANAQVPLRIVAKDDLGLKRLRLEYAKPEASTAEYPGFVVLLEGTDRPLHHEAAHVLELSEMKLAAGDQVVLHATATDAYDLGAKHIGRSLPRTLTVVTTEEKKHELSGRQADILSDLESVHRRQSHAHEQVRQLQIQLREAGEFQPGDLDTLQRAEMAQRQVAKSLTDESDGILQRSRRLLDELHNNKIEDPETAQRMAAVGAEVSRLGKENLPPIEQNLTAVRKKAQTAPEKSPSSLQQQTLETAAEHQRVVLESLGEMLRDLSQWRTHRELADDLDRLIESQQQLNRDTADVGGRTLAKPQAELTPQEKSDLARLGDRQRQSAKLLDQWKSKIEESLQARQDEQSSETELLQESIDQIEEQATAGRMRETARQLQRNNIGEAGQNQQQLLEQLRALHDTLRNKRQTDTATLLKKLKKAEEELAKQKDEQQEILRKIKKAQQLDDPEQRKQELQKLQKRQQKLRDAVAKLSRKLRRLQVRDASGATKRAADRQRQAAENLDRGESSEAAQQAQEATDDLEQAQRELAQERRRVEARLAQEQLEKIAEVLRTMIPRQQGVIDETRRLNGLFKQRKKWSRSTLKSLRDLTEVEQGLQQETERLVETLTAAEVFALALRGAARDMNRSVELLAARETGAETQQREERARQRFVDLVEAIKPDETTKAQKQQQSPQNGKGQTSPSTDGIPPLAQLKLLRILQQDLQDRTKQIPARLADGDDITPADRRTLNDLAIEQGELADLARNLMKIATPEQSREPIEDKRAAEGAEP